MSLLKISGVSSRVMLFSSLMIEVIMFIVFWNSCKKDDCEVDQLSDCLSLSFIVLFCNMRGSVLITLAVNAINRSLVGSVKPSPPSFEGRNVLNRIARCG